MSLYVSVYFLGSSLLQLGRETTKGNIRIEINFLFISK